MEESGLPCPYSNSSNAVLGKIICSCFVRYTSPFSYPLAYRLHPFHHSLLNRYAGTKSGSQSPVGEVSQNGRIPGAPKKSTGIHHLPSHNTAPFKYVHIYIYVNIYIYNGATLGGASVTKGVQGSFSWQGISASRKYRRIILGTVPKSKRRRLNHNHRASEQQSPASQPETESPSQYRWVGNKGKYHVGIIFSFSLLTNSMLPC